MTRPGMKAQDEHLLLLLLVLAGVAMTYGLATTKPQLLARPNHLCALRSTGQVDCWGDSIPSFQKFWAISSGDSFTCALAYDGHVDCWGNFQGRIRSQSYSLPTQSVVVGNSGLCLQTANLKWQCPLGPYMSPLDKSLSQVALHPTIACGILAQNGHPYCWGSLLSQEYESVVLAQIVMGDSRMCGVQQGTGELWCTNLPSADQQEEGDPSANCVGGVMTPECLSGSSSPPNGQFIPGTLISRGDNFCALNVNNNARCWGPSYPNSRAAPDPLAGMAGSQFVQLTLGEGFGCGLQADGTPLCWGDDTGGVTSPPVNVKFILVSASTGYACGMREDEVTVCWGDRAPIQQSCHKACFRNGTLNLADCRCECPSGVQDCTCSQDTCKNGDRVHNDGYCSCRCGYTCPAGCVRNADCSCSCPATAPYPTLSYGVPDSAPSSAISYLIAGGESTIPVKRVTDQNIAGADECSHALLYMDLAHTPAWAPASCADSGSLFMGANMANLDINKYPLASVRLSGDQDGGWLYRIVKCVPATNTLLLCPRNWLMDSVHCPGPTRDCSQCLPLGRGLNSTADYSRTCTKVPAPTQAARLPSVILAGSYSGYHAEPRGSLWGVTLPRDVTCTTRFLMFRSQEWRLDLGAALVKLHADGNGDYQYIDRGCDDTTSTLLLETYQWTISPARCPNLDCSACLPSSQGDCVPSLMAPYGLEAATSSNTNVLSLSWKDSGAPPGTTYAVYIRNARGFPVRYTTSSLQIQVALNGTGLGPRLQAKVVRVYCPTTCPVGGCYSGSLQGVQLARSVEESHTCDNGVVDCMGVCNGTALVNPCGVCALPADYYQGEGYFVDCANTCGGSAYIGECGVCVGGRSGLPPNAHKDCQGTCFGKATRDDCGVCHEEGDGHSSRDCTGLCGGKAVVDECGQCVLGTTGREFNGDMDCAGQCFGKRLPTDPACQCKREELDQCFVCGGDNSTCAGCDGGPNSGLVRDLCGVCGGDNTTCCFLPFAQTTVVIRDFQAIALRSTLDAGETLLVQNLHEGRGYTVVLERLDDHTQAFVSKLQPGYSVHIELSRPGQYRLSTVESSTVSADLTVLYNAKTTDACGHCIDPHLQVDAPQTAAYEHCCSVMDSNNVHAWFTTTYYYHESALPLQAPARVVPRSENYRSAPTRHLLRLVKPQTVDTSVWSAECQRLAVGDVVVLENRDLLDHVISITGPQPLPDVVLDSGTVVVVGPLLTPGTYRLVSSSNLINTTFTVEFDFACTVHATEEAQRAAYEAIASYTLVGTFALAVVLAVGIFVAAAVYMRAWIAEKRSSTAL